MLLKNLYIGPCFLNMPLIVADISCFAKHLTSAALPSNVTCRYLCFKDVYINMIKSYYRYVCAKGLFSGEASCGASTCKLCLLHNWYIIHVALRYLGYIILGHKAQSTVIMTKTSILYIKCKKKRESIKFSEKIMTKCNLAFLTNGLPKQATILVLQMQ